MDWNVFIRKLLFPVACLGLILAAFCGISRLQTQMLYHLLYALILFWPVALPVSLLLVAVVWGTVCWVIIRFFGACEAGIQAAAKRKHLTTLAARRKAEEMYADRNDDN